MSTSRCQQAIAILSELIQDAEHRRDNLKLSDALEEARQEWVGRAWDAIIEVKALRVLPQGAFNSFNNPDISGSLEFGEASDAATAAKREFDHYIRYLKKVRVILLAPSTLGGLSSRSLPNSVARWQKKSIQCSIESLGIRSR